MSNPHSNFNAKKRPAAATTDTAWTPTSKRPKRNTTPSSASASASASASTSRASFTSTSTSASTSTTPVSLRDQRHPQSRTKRKQKTFKQTYQSPFTITWNSVSNDTCTQIISHLTTYLSCFRPRHVPLTTTRRDRKAKAKAAEQSSSTTNTATDTTSTSPHVSASASASASSTTSTNTSQSNPKTSTSAPTSALVQAGVVCGINACIKALETRSLAVVLVVRQVSPVALISCFPLLSHTTGTPMIVLNTSSMILGSALHMRSCLACGIRSNTTHESVMQIHTLLQPHAAVQYIPWLPPNEYIQQHPYQPPQYQYHPLQVTNEGSTRYCVDDHDNTDDQPPKQPPQQKQQLAHKQQQKQKQQKQQQKQRTKQCTNQKLAQPSAAQPVVAPPAVT